MILNTIFIVKMGQNISRLLVIITFFSCITVNAQIGLNPDKHLDKYNSDHWTSEEGLSDISAIYAIQAKSGYIWFVSYGGVTRFDGINFHTFNSYNTPEIVNNSFTHIYEDNEGFIWACSSGNGVTTIKNNKVKVFTREDGLPSNFGEEVVQDLDGRLWIATSHGLAYKDDDRFMNNDVPEPLKSISLKSIDCDENNHLWVATIDQGVYQIYKGKIITHYTKENGLLSNNINFIRADQGHVWIGTDSGMNTIVKGQVISSTVADGLPNNMVTASYFDSNGQLWVGTYHGFCRFGINEKQYLNKRHPLYGRDITSILEDHEGNLWITTYRGGLFKLWDGKFTNFSDYDLGAERPFTVHSIIQKDDHNFVIVYEDGVSVLNSIDATLSPFDPEVQQIGSKFKSGIRDSKGRYWFATSNGLILYAHGRVTKITDQQGLVNNNVRTVFEDSKGQIWAGTFFGVTKMSEDGTPLVSYIPKDGLSHEYVMQIMEDSKENIWISTKGGLNKFSGEEFEVFGEKDGMAGDFVFKIFEDKDGVIWIGGNAGLTRFKNGEFKKITISDGLTGNTIFQVLEDDFGYLWFTTNQNGASMFKVNKKELNDFCDGKIKKVNSIEYNQRDGIMAISATSSATSLKAADGKLWFATHRGVELIDPGNIKINEFKPPAIIESVKKNGYEMDLGSPIVINSGKQRITFKFTGLSFIASEDVHLKYQLVGYDESWVTADQTRETSYTNLRDGKYTFKVMAANSDGIWNEHGATISFTVLPHFYETWWFYISCSLIFFSSAYGYFKWKTMSMRKSAILLENKVHERTIQLEQKSTENETLYELSSNLISPIELEELLKGIIEGAVAVIPKAQNGTILLLNSANNILEGKVSFGIPDEEIKKVRIKVGEGQSGKAVAEKRSFIENNYSDYPFIKSLGIAEEYKKLIKSIIVVLLKEKDKIIGTISLDNHQEYNAFSEKDMEVLSSFAANASVAIERVRMHKEIEEKIEIIKKSERQLLENQGRFKDAFQLSRIAIWEFDALTNNLLLNEEWCDIVGIDYSAKSPVLGLNEYYENIVHDDDKDHFNNIYSKALDTHNDSYQDIIKYRITIPNGDIVWLMKTIRVRLDDESKVATLYGTIQDINEIKKTEDELKSRAAELKAQSEELLATNDRLIELDEYKEAMTGMIVHDFKNSLNTVISFSEGTPTQRRLKSIRQAGQFMLNMVMNILDVQKFETTEIKLAPSNNPISKVIKEAESQLSYMIEQKSINLTYDLDPSYICRFDFELTTRVIVNILSNAIKYVPANGHINITAELKNNFVLTSIQDDGPGIPTDKIEMVFDKYSQINAKASGSVRSTGIGLTFCKMVVEAQGGTIGVTSEEGKGSNFYFTLPLSEITKELKPTSEKVKIELAKDKSMVLSEKDKKILAPIIDELKQWEVYDYSEVTTILERVNGKSGNIKSWKEQLIKALQNVNEERYNELVNID